MIVSLLILVLLDATKALPSDVLHTIEKAFPEAHLPEYAEDLATARHLSKHIWPRLYGMMVETCHRNGRRTRLDETITARGVVRTPDRLKTVLPLLRELLQRHAKCDYRQILRQLAPSTASTSHADSHE